MAPHTSSSTHRAGRLPIRRTTGRPVRIRQRVLALETACDDVARQSARDRARERRGRRGLLLLSFCSRLYRGSRRSGRIRDTRNGDEVHRASRIRSPLSVVLCPSLHILVRIRRIRVEYKRCRRQRLLLLYLRLRLY